MADSKQNLPQLYRFCFLMTGDSEKAQSVFRRVLRDAEALAAQGEPPADRLWFFRTARELCLIAGETGLQAEAIAMDERELSPSAPLQIARLEAEQLAIWISAAPEPQRSVLSLFYLDEFNLRELLSLLAMKVNDLADHLTSARFQLQAWLDRTFPSEAP